MPTTPEQREILLREIADGRSVRDICDEHDIPRRTFYREVMEDADLAHQYARAMEIRADVHFDETFEIADDGQNDWMERHDKDGGNIGWQENGEALGRSRLRLDQRKWALARMNPKKYGEKLAVGGADDLPPVQIELSETEIARRIAFTLARAVKEQDNG